MTEPAGGTETPNRRGHLAIEAPELALAGFLAALAGIVDAIGYLHLGGLFVSYMSGNSTRLAMAIGQATSSKQAPSPVLSHFSCSGPLQVKS